MRELPRIFTTEMVRAILSGKKTQTRRLDGLHKINKDPDGYEFLGFSEDEDVVFFRKLKGGMWGSVETIPVPFPIKCPVQVGDHMYVRETWGIGCRPDPFFGWRDGIEYKADEYFIDENDVLPLYTEKLPDNFEDYIGKKGWQSSRDMPKSFARIWREIKDVRFERIQEITADEADAEGSECEMCRNTGYTTLNEHSQDECHCDTVDIFKDLWDSINAKRGYPFDLNPWVRVESFKEIEK